MMRIVCRPLLLCLAGCSDMPPRVELPGIDPVVTAAAVLDLYDHDGDQALSGDELAKVPGIQRALGHFDPDDDGEVTCEEIATRIRQWQDTKIGIAPAFGCTVFLEGKPLRGATVRLQPEPFFDGQIAAGVGLTDEQGVAFVAIPQEDLPEPEKGLIGMRLGIYKVLITHPTADLPARYNTSTTLGQELSNHTIMLTEKDTVYRLKRR